MNLLNCFTNCIESMHGYFLVIILQLTCPVVSFPSEESASIFSLAFSLAMFPALNVMDGFSQFITNHLPLGSVTFQAHLQKAEEENV